MIISISSPPFGSFSVITKSVFGGLSTFATNTISSPSLTTIGSIDKIEAGALSSTATGASTVDFVAIAPLPSTISLAIPSPKSELLKSDTISVISPSREL